MTEYAPEGQHSADLEYDLAHEESGQPPVDLRHHEPVQVATETPEYSGGDYGYDLAHDVPGREG